MPPNLNDCCTSLMLMPDCTRPLVDSSLLMVMPDSCWRWCRTPVDRWPSPRHCYLLTIYTARPCVGAEWRNHCLSHAHLPKVCFHEVSIISRDFISETRANIILFHMHELETMLSSSSPGVRSSSSSSPAVRSSSSSSAVSQLSLSRIQKLWRVVEIWTQLKQTLCSDYQPWSNHSRFKNFTILICLASQLAGLALFVEWTMTTLVVQQDRCSW